MKNSRKNQSENKKSSNFFATQQNITVLRKKDESRKSKRRQKQEDLLDLKTALLKFNCFLSTTVATQCTFEVILDDSLITVDITSLDQHRLYYCTISRSRCEISDDVIVLIWNFLWDMYGHEDTNTINNSFLS